MIGKRLKQLRAVTGKTQHVAADEIGIKRERYAHYETNRREPDLQTLVKIASYYQVSTDYLLMRTEFPKMIEQHADDEHVSLDEVRKKLIEGK